MAKVTIIKSDKAVYLEGEVVFSVDMSGLPDDFHALQWDGANGEIEYIGNVKPNLTISSESEIEKELGVSLATMLERRQAQIDAEANPIMPAQVAK